MAIMQSTKHATGEELGASLTKLPATLSSRRPASQQSRFGMLTTFESDRVEVLSIGEAMVLVAPQQLSRLASAPICTLTAAGAESNVAKVVASLGHTAAWFSAVGDDPFGHLILADLEGVGVDTGTVVVSVEHRTGLYAKDPDPSGSRVYYYRDGSAASHLRPQDLPKLAGQPRVVHTSGIMAALSETCDDLITSVVTDRIYGDALVSFDVNFRSQLWQSSEVASARILKLAVASDVVFVGLDEAEELWGTRTVDEVRELMPGVSRLVVKDGARDAIEFGRGSRTVERAAGVSVVDLVGAGDAFAGGWLSAWLAGRDASHRLRLGHLMASRVLHTTGDYAPPPNRDEIDSALTAWPPNESREGPYAVSADRTAHG